MRILLDENTPGVRRILIGHDVRSAPEMGWAAYSSPLHREVVREESRDRWGSWRNAASEVIDFAGNGSGGSEFLAI